MQYTFGRSLRTKLAVAPRNDLRDTGPRHSQLRWCNSTISTEGEVNLLSESAIFLAAAVVTVPLFRRFKLGAVLGYLTAGVLIGPYGLRFLSAGDNLLHLAELGVVLLLFIIGLELQPSRLWVLRRSVFGLGFAQVLGSTVAIGGIALALGVRWQTALVIGFGLAMSSTAFVLQVLAERRELT